MGFWNNFGKSVANKVTGGLIDSAFGALNAWQNFQYGEKAANAADERQRAQFKDMYSLEAQMNQIKDAGLSPSMFFSGGLSGQGGANAPQGTGASGPIFNSSPIDPVSAAQIDALEEDTRGKKIENDKKEELINTDIALKLSQIGLNKASQAYTDTQNMRANIAARIEGATEGIQIDKIMNEADYMFWESYKCQYEAKGEETKYQFDLETFKTRVDIVAAEYSKILTDIREGNSRIQLNQATIKNMAKQIAIDWYNAKVGYMSYQAQKKWYQEQIYTKTKELVQQGILTRQQFEVIEKGQWMNLGADVFGSICNIGAVGANAYFSKPK